MTTIEILKSMKCKPSKDIIIILNKNIISDDELGSEFHELVNHANEMNQLNRIDDRDATLTKIKTFLMESIEDKKAVVMEDLTSIYHSDDNQPTPYYESRGSKLVNIGMNILILLFLFIQAYFTFHSYTTIFLILSIKIVNDASYDILGSDILARIIIMLCFWQGIQVVNIGNMSLQNTFISASMLILVYTLTGQRQLLRYISYSDFNVANGSDTIDILLSLSPSQCVYLFNHNVNKDDFIRGKAAYLDAVNQLKTFGLRDVTSENLVKSIFIGEILNRDDLVDKETMILLSDDEVDKKINIMKDRMRDD